MEQNIQLKFNQELHKYTDNYDNVYTSVTQFIDLHKPKFDEMYWAARKAKERGVEVGVVLAEWELIRNNACDRGNATHEFLEDSVNNIYDNSSIEFKQIVERTHTLDYSYKISNERELYFSPLREKMPKIFYSILNYIKAGYVLYAEKRVYSFKYKIAGTIDLLLVRGEEFIILDWKTNKDALKFVAGYYKKDWVIVDGKNVKVKTNQWINKDSFLDYPFNNLAECKGILYTLQLSLYAYLVEMFGLKCKGLYLFHIVDNDYDNIKDYKIEYIKSDIGRGLDFHLKNRLEIKSKNKFGII